MDTRVPLKSAVKRGLADAMYRAGLLHRRKQRMLRDRAIVLMYHRVLADDDLAVTGSHPGIIVHERTFAMHMALLARHFAVLSPEQFGAHLRDGQPFPDGACLITFDDGWRDNQERALPILRQFGLPALIFLPVNFIGQARLFWREALTHLLTLAIARVRQQPGVRQRLAGLLQPLQLTAILDLPQADPRAAISDTVGRLKDTAAETVHALVDGLADVLQVRVSDLGERDRFVDWTQVRGMVADGITFGGHGAEHRLLTHVPPAEARHEIQVAREQLAAHVTPPVWAFSYPNGNWTPAVADEVRAAGFALGFTTAAGPVAHTDDPYALNRVNIHEGATSTPALFLARLLGMF